MRSLVLVAVVACVDTPPLHEPEVSASHVELHEMPPTRLPKLDVLVVIDDGVWTSPHAERAATLPALVAERLGTLTSQWTDLRIAVTGNDGRFRRLPGADMAYLADAYAFDYTREASYAGSLDDAFAILMHSDEPSTPTSQPLEATRLALERNALFVRDDAALAVITITAGDDASPLDVTEYARWMLGLAGGLDWGRKPVLALGIHPAPAPRLDEYYRLLRDEVHAFAQVTPLETGELRAALRSIGPMGSFWGGNLCVETEDLDARADGFQHECALFALVDEAWRAVPECSIASAVTERSAPVAAPTGPVPACWRLVPDVYNCYWGSRHTLELRGYREFAHPGLRFECRSR